MLGEFGLVFIFMAADSPIANASSARDSFSVESVLIKLRLVMICTAGEKMPR